MKFKYFVNENEEKGIKYFVNEEKGTVFCKMKNCFRDTINILEKDSIYKRDLRDCFMRNTYTGKAKLSPEDEWDEETGKRVARNKMLLKYYTKRKKILDNIYVELLLQLQKIVERKNYCLEKIAKAKNCEL